MRTGVKGSESQYRILLLETIRFHQILSDLMQGNEGDLESVFEQIENMIRGSRLNKEDRQLTKAVYGSMSMLVDGVIGRGLIKRFTRRVRLKKKMGNANDEFAEGTEKVGWEKGAPKIGKSYHLYLDNGRLFRTGRINEVGMDYFRTESSLYELRVIE